MPLRDKRAYLWDVLEAAKSISTMVATKTFADYLAERPLRSAIEREFEIIGEALNQAERHFPELRAEISDFAKIVGLRNRLIHAYFGIDHEIIWGTIELFLPQLVKDVKALLETT
jgi:uncharacterized protein with HEPN domain